jgi:hypothetical protein
MEASMTVQRVVLAGACAVLLSGQLPPEESLRVTARGALMNNTEEARTRAWHEASEETIRQWLPALCGKAGPATCKRLETLLLMDADRVVKVREEGTKKPATLPGEGTQWKPSPFIEASVTPDMKRVQGLLDLARWLDTPRTTDVVLTERTPGGPTARTGRKDTVCTPFADELLADIGLKTRPSALLTVEDVERSGGRGLGMSAGILRQARDQKVAFPLVVNLEAQAIHEDGGADDMVTEALLGSAAALSPVGKASLRARARCPRGNPLETSTCMRFGCRAALRPAVLDALVDGVHGDARLPRVVDVQVAGVDDPQLAPLATALRKAIKAFKAVEVDTLPGGTRVLAVRVVGGDESSVAELLDGKAVGGFKLGVTGVSQGLVELSAVK